MNDFQIVYGFSFLMCTAFVLYVLVIDPQTGRRRRK